MKPRHRTKPYPLPLIVRQREAVGRRCPLTNIMTRVPVDVDLDLAALDRLNALPGFWLNSVCAGHRARRARRLEEAHVGGWITTPTVERLQRAPPSREFALSIEPNDYWRGTRWAPIWTYHAALRPEDAVTEAAGAAWVSTVTRWLEGALCGRRFAAGMLAEQMELELAGD